MISPKDNEGYDPLDDEFDDEEEDEFESFDCAMSFDKRGKAIGCGKAGSEECDFECPYARLFGWG